MGPPLSGAERVLLRLPRWVGDFVMAEPLVRAFAGRFEALSLVGPARCLALLEGRFEGARRVADAGAPDGWRGHDVAFLCTGSLRSAWHALRAGIPRRIGYARDGRTALLTDALRPARERGATPLGLGRPGRFPRFLPRPLERSLAELAGLVGVVVRDLRPRIEVRGEWSERAVARLRARGLRGNEPFVLASVGARAGSAKGAPAEVWGPLLEALARESGLPVLLVGGPGEDLAPVARRVPRALPLTGRPVDLAELAALCAQARLVLAADSGPRHVARAVGASVVCLAGPTDPRHTAGVRPRERLVRHTVPCGPCHREHCSRKEAPLECWMGIEGAELVAAAQDLLGART
jgi:heptosyltransferase-2